MLRKNDSHAHCCCAENSLNILSNNFHIFSQTNFSGKINFPFYFAQQKIRKHFSLWIGRRKIGSTIKIGIKIRFGRQKIKLLILFSSCRCPTRKFFFANSKEVYFASCAVCANRKKSKRDLLLGYFIAKQMIRERNWKVFCVPHNVIIIQVENWPHSWIVLCLSLLWPSNLLSILIKESSWWVNIIAGKMWRYFFASGGRKGFEKKLCEKFHRKTR